MPIKEVFDPTYGRMISVKFPDKKEKPMKLYKMTGWVVIDAIVLWFEYHKERRDREAKWKCDVVNKQGNIFWR